MYGIVGWASSAKTPDYAESCVKKLRQSEGGKILNCVSVHQCPGIVFAGPQTFSDSTTRYILLFYGKIFNSPELYDELLSCGIYADKHSIEKIILCGYEQWGTQIMEKLRGAFALALYDTQTNMLLLARDRIGSKTLYYQANSNGLAFASEVRTLLGSGATAQISKDALRGYLAYGSIQDPFTLIDGIRSLPPGHWMLWKDGYVKLQRYWTPCLIPHPWKNLDMVQEAVTAKLLEVIQQQCTEDTAVGAFLSGGIDSSAIVGLMRKVTSSPIRTFCIIHDDPRFDERQYARRAAECNDTEHTELLLDGTTIKRYLRCALNDYDQPSMDGLNVWFISRLVHDAGLKIALTGLGGDELFVGYNRFERFRKMYAAAKFLRHLPAICGVPFIRLAGSEALRKFGQLCGNQDAPYYMVRRVLSDYQINALVKEEFRSQISVSPRLSGLPDDTINQISIHELNNYIVSTAMRDGEQMSAIHGLETRSPLLDHELIELMLSIPGTMKLDKAIVKPLLVRAAGKQLPRECVFRPKLGFTLPFDQYFHSELNDELEAFVAGSKEGIFAPETLQKLYHQYQREQVNWSRIWQLFVLDFYCRNHHLHL